MVSKASEDFPLPLGPVMTVNFPSGRSRSIPLRLFWRAPRISTQPRAGDAVRQGFSAVVEPTGDYLIGRTRSQIFGVENNVIPRLAQHAEGPLSRRANHPSPLARSTQIGVTNGLALICVTRKRL